MTREQFTKGAQLLDKISCENVIVSELEELKEIAISKKNRFVLSDGYNRRVELSKSNAAAAIESEILVCKTKIGALESEFAVL